MITFAFIWGILMGAFGFHKFVAAKAFKSAKLKGYKEGLADAIELKSLLDQTSAMLPFLKASDRQVVEESIKNIKKLKEDKNEAVNRTN